MYNTVLFTSLDPAEKEQVRQLKSEYFKKRFTVSRCLLRYIIRQITGTGNPGGIVLVKEKNGPMRLTTRQDIFIFPVLLRILYCRNSGKKKDRHRH